jgi:hypothetical protein
MNLLTVKDAIIKAPAIGYESSVEKYLPTKDILKGILSKGWFLKDVHQQGKRAFTQHCAVIIHEDTMRDDVALQQGHPQLYIWNTKEEISFLTGWYNPITKVDFIAPSIFMQDNVFKHKKNNLSIDELVKKLDYCKIYFESYKKTINESSRRILTDMERLAFANFATDIRYRKKKKPFSFNSFSLLSSSKVQDTDNSVWSVSHIILDNIINGSKNGGNGIKSFKEKLLFCHKFWFGFTACNIFRNDNLFHAFIDIANEF